MTLTLPDGSIHYERVGSGPPMLLMHGMGLDHTVFRPWLDPLADDYEVTFYDHLGNGRSTYRGDLEKLTHERWVETADALRDHLGHEQVMVLGHSYGAFIALEYALRHGDRLLGLVLSAVTPAWDYPEAVMANAERKADPALFRRVGEALSGPPESDAELADSFRAIHPLYFHRYDPARDDAVLADVRFSAAAMARSMFGEVLDYDVEDRLGEIGVPTLVVSGDDDWITPPEHGGARVAAGIPGAEHVVLEECGHWPFVERPERFLDVVGSWLEELE